ncbi:hypothetical protein SSP35_01_07120 [Streptomyces sp. NBRC 110611]|nr:hypothetical protein SSP35_01_07120 [Streptomyces sp. NBRC 110611]
MWRCAGGGERGADQGTGPGRGRMPGDGKPWAESLCGRLRRRRGTVAHVMEPTGNERPARWAWLDAKEAPLRGIQGVGEERRAAGGAANQAEPDGNLWQVVEWAPNRARGAARGTTGAASKATSRRES